MALETASSGAQGPLVELLHVDKHYQLMSESFEEEHHVQEEEGPGPIVHNCQRSSPASGK